LTAMARAVWSVDLPEGRHEIEAVYGYSFHKATIRVDGRIVSASRPLMKMSIDMGVDLPIDVDGHALVVSVRPVLRAKYLATAYRLGLSVDGAPAPGTERLPPVRPASNPLAPLWLAGGRPGGPVLVEMMCWATVGGGVIGLSRNGENPWAFLYIAAPAACSVVTRRTTMPTWLMALVCLTIVLGGTIALATLGVVAT